MIPIFKVINRCIVVEFYKQNAAFFGLIFLVFFGFIKASEHIAIGSFLVANSSTLAYLYILWLAYAIKVILFILPAINKEENHFLESFYLLPFKIKIVAASFATFLLLLPIVAYASFLILLAIPETFYLSITLLVLSIFTITGAISYLLLVKLNSLPHEKSFVQIKLFNRISKPSFLFFLEHIARKEIVLLILSKLYAGALIIGTSLLYQTDQFDLRLLTTGVLLAFVGNVAIIYKYVWFQYHQMAFSGNLPQSLFQLLIRQTITFSILLIPEFIVLLRYYPIEPKLVDLMGIVLFGFSLFTLIYGLLLIKQIELSQFMATIFWVVVLSTFLILFSIHPLILAILYLFISVSIIYFRHYRFEYIEK